MSETKRRGDDAEALAARYLTARGLTLVARNFRTRFGEIDLICRDGATLVFVEVRARGSASFGGALASITAAKQAKLAKAAQQYLATLARTPPCRFDVVLLEGDKAIEWIKDAFAGE